MKAIEQMKNRRHLYQVNVSGGYRALSKLGSSKMYNEQGEYKKQVLQVMDVLKDTLTDMEVLSYKIVDKKYNDYIERDKKYKIEIETIQGKEKELFTMEGYVCNVGVYDF